MSYAYSLLYSLPGLGSVLGVLLFALEIWMIVDCFRSGNDAYWIAIILLLGPVGILIYYFNCMHGTSRVERSFSKRLNDRRRIQELQRKIHHLDKADHYAELGNIYRAQKKWALAQEAYQAALERDAEMFDARAYLGFVLLAQGRPQEAAKLLEPALQQQPNFKSGELLWQCARCRTALGQLAEARALYEKFLAGHGYFEAQYEYVLLLDKMGDRAGAATAAHELVEDAKYTPKFHRRACRPWMKKARRYLRAGRSVTA